MGSFGFAPLALATVLGWAGWTTNVLRSLVPKLWLCRRIPDIRTPREHKLISHSSPLSVCITSFIPFHSIHAGVGRTWDWTWQVGDLCRVESNDRLRFRLSPIF